MSIAVLIMAGGSGERFWPLSTKEKPKQLLKLIDSERSLIRMTVDRVLPLTDISRVFIATNSIQAPAVKEELPDLPVGNIIIEPAFKDTAAAIGFGTTVIESIYPNSTIVVLASDHLIKNEDNFIKRVKTAVETGTSLAGEISTLGITEDIFAKSDIGGIWFQEYLGDLNRGSDFKESLSKHISSNEQETSNNHNPANHKKRSIAGHAPHTTSPELLRFLKQKSRLANLPFSIHAAESDDETEFITTGQGGWADFLKERGIDFSSWKQSSSSLNQSGLISHSKNALSRSPVQYLHDMGLLDEQTLAVHLLNVNSQDIEIIAQTQAKPVFCPRSNFNLHQKLPDIPLFLKYGLKPALGTDSLASSETLNMFDEMLYLAEKFPNITPSDILAMATLNSADALGFSTIAGSIEKGRRADFIYVPLSVSLNKPKIDISDIIMRIIEYKSTK